MGSNVSNELTGTPRDPRSAPLLWQNVSAEMSLEEVQRARPRSIRADGSANLASGARADLVEPDFELNGELYLVQFFFLNDALTQVTLTREDIISHSSAHGLMALLRAKYGPELKLRLPDGIGYLTMLEAEWMASNGVNVSLVSIDGVCLNLNYQVRMAQELGKV
jgi:hypothetical protein